MSEVPVTAPANAIVARASRDYRWRRYILVIVLFGYGLLSLYHGFVHYPNENEKAKREHPGIEILPYPGLDVPFNKTFGVALPPLSLLFLGWVFYASRGKYEFDGTTLKAPGHGAVPLKSILKIDRSKWDRKGIAYLHYQVPGNAKLGVLALDDFIYERKPTDAIFAHVVESVEPSKTPVTAPMAQQRINCSFCGVQNSPTASVCSNCGAPLDIRNLISNK